MSFLYTVFIAPLELLFEVFFNFFMKGFNNYGLAIIGLSLVITVITLPLYHVAEKIQQKERDDRKRLESGIRRIKETFKGDERFMMLSTFYRQNNYHPAYVLRGSVGLLIQVPFFIAAYHFLSHLQQLHGSSFYFIEDLGKPDQLLSFGTMRINLLPILMTIINIGSGIIYTQGFAFRDKAQLYGMAGLFLLILYNSPAGLVLYWTFNNIFSLMKNAFYKLKKPLLVAYLLMAIGVPLGLGIIWSRHSDISISKKIMLVAIGLIAVFAPLLVHLGKVLLRVLSSLSEKPKIQNRIFYLASIILFLLFGLVIPSNLIASSVIEFSMIGGIDNPLEYLGYTMTFFLGLWIVWPLFLYWISNKPIKTLLAMGISLLALTSLINTFVFPGDYGVISHMLRFDNGALLEAHGLEFILPPVLSVGVALLLTILIRKKQIKVVASILTIFALGLTGSAVYSSAVINKEYRQYKLNLSDIGQELVETIEPAYHFSKTGKNVLYIFLDRAMNSYFPSIIEELPELKDQLSGFTFYPNAVSFGSTTVYGAPPMLGGYEYTVDEVNKRESELLVDKHNESLLVMPKLFLDGGFSVTLTDPPFSNYQWEGDFTPFKSYPKMNVLHHKGPFVHVYKNEHATHMDWQPEYENALIKKYLPMFSFLKASFPLMRDTIYEEGRYFLTSEPSQSFDLYLDSYSHLYYLRELSSFDAEGDVYINISNDTTHTPTRLQTPEYEPRSHITSSSTPYDSVEGIREIDVLHYYVNAAALKRIGLWFDQLREEGVYDNTRIIIVSDHGRDLYSKGMADFTNNRYEYNGFIPLLLMKEFDATEPLSMDNVFMTNADAPLFAIRDLTSPVNPFTGKNMYDQVKKDRVNVYSGPHDPTVYKGSTKYRPYVQGSFSVSEDIYVEENWGPVEIEGANR